MGVKGRQDPIPLWKRSIASWPPDWREEYEERAALKIDGATDVYLTPEQAEKAAYEEVRERMGA